MSTGRMAIGRPYPPTAKTTTDRRRRRETLFSPQATKRFLTRQKPLPFAGLRDVEGKGIILVRRHGHGPSRGGVGQVLLVHILEERRHARAGAPQVAGLQARPMLAGNRVATFARKRDGKLPILVD